MNKNQLIKSCMPFVIIVFFSVIFGFYMLSVWGKASNIPVVVFQSHSKTVVKMYDGKWEEDIKKIGEFWSVGYLRVNQVSKIIN